MVFSGLVLPYMDMGEIALFLIGHYKKNPPGQPLWADLEGIFYYSENYVKI
mgnify:CR=1 FL=1